MNGSLGGLGAHFVALVVGGMIGSLGLSLGARTRRLQPWLARLTGWQVGLGSVALIAAGIVGGWRIGSRLLETDAAAFHTLPLPLVALFGIAIGLPISVPGIAAAWSEARRKDRKAKKARDFVPTKDDRREYADQIVRQILDVSPRPRSLSASISGDGGTVLLFEGDIDAEEGERLTAALRADLTEVGFKRVEGTRGGKAWWCRV